MRRLPVWIDVFAQIIIITLFLAYTAIWLVLQRFGQQVNINTSKIGLKGNSGRKLNVVIVIGSSWEGWLAAATLTQHAKHVILIERNRIDRLDLRQIKENDQAFVVHLRTLQIIEKLFPGITNELILKGAQPVDWGSQCWWRSAGGWRATVGKNYLSMNGISCSKQLLESTIQGSTMQLQNVQIIEKCEVMQLIWDDNLDVTGVICKDSKNEEFTIESDLVIDCTGRKSVASRWFLDAGLVVQKDSFTTVVKTVSQLYEFPRYEKIPFEILYYQPIPPDKPFGLMMTSCGSNTFWVTEYSYDNSELPQHPLEFKEFPRYHRMQVAAEWVMKGRPVNDKMITSQRENSQIYQYERHSVAGFVAVGESVCSLNINNGINHVLAADAILLLDDMLRSGSSLKKFSSALSRQLTVPWLLHTSYEYPFAFSYHPSWFTKLVHRLQLKMLFLTTKDNFALQLWYMIFHQTQNYRTIFANLRLWWKLYRMKSLPSKTVFDDSY